MTNNAIDRAIAEYQAATAPAAIKAEIQRHKELCGLPISAADLRQGHAAVLVHEISQAACVA